MTESQCRLLASVLALLGIAFLFVFGWRRHG
jgi:hypothetical protein